MLIKLIFPPYTEVHILNRIYPVPPLGIAVLKSFLERHGYKVEIMDLAIQFQDDDYKVQHNNEKNIDFTTFYDHNRVKKYLNGIRDDPYIDTILDRLLQDITYRDVDLIGFSVIMMPQLLLTLALAKRIKEDTDIKIVLGGPSITLFGNEILKDFSFIDYGIIGDGEMPLLKLVQRLESNRLSEREVPGLIYRMNNSIVINDIVCLDINDVPPPDFDGLPFDRYRRKVDGTSVLVLPYEMGKGCSHNCSFCNRLRLKCTESKSSEKVIRSPKKIVSELRELSKKYNTKFFVFQDNSINRDINYLSFISNALIKTETDIMWDALARPTNFNKKLLNKILEAGCVKLRYGVESGSNKILKHMRKGFSVENVEKVLKNSHKAGIWNHLFFIAGYINENDHDISQTVDFMKRNWNYIDNAHISAYRLTINTPTFTNPEKFGIKYMYPNKNEIYKYSYAFDEVNGLTWEDKQKQQEQSFNILLSTLEDKTKTPFVHIVFYAYSNSNSAKEAKTIIREYTKAYSIKQSKSMLGPAIKKE